MSLATRLVLLFLLVLGGAAAHAETRIALVVANAAYEGAPLGNPTVDAGLVRDALGRLGFDVTVAENVALGDFDAAIDGFEEKARGADLALFYFAGHGFAVSDGRGPRNYLMAVDADVTSKSDRVIRAGGVALDEITSGLGAAAKATLVFVDACRDDPTVSRGSGGGTRGLARVEEGPGENIFVGLSTRPGDTATDGDPGAGSPFARAFAANIGAPGLRLDDAFTRVRLAVEAETGRDQRPEVARYDLAAPIVLGVAAAGPDAAAAPGVTAVPAATVCAGAKESYAEAKDLGTADGWQAFLAAYPDCPPETGFAQVRLSRLDAPEAPAETETPPAEAADAAPAADSATADKAEAGETEVAAAPAEAPTDDAAAADPAASPEPSVTVLHTLAHGAGVVAVAVSPDSARVATATSAEDGIVRLWSAADGTLERELEGEGGAVAGIAFSPDGATVAVAGGDGTVRLRNVEDGGLAGTVEPEVGALRGIAFSPDGATLAVASGDGEARLHNVADGSLLQTLDPPGAAVDGVLYSPDGSLVATRAADTSDATLWNPADGGAVRTLQGKDADVIAITFSPDGTLFATSAWDDAVRLWRVEDGALLHTLQGQGGGAQAVAFNGDGTVLMSGCGDDTIKLWRVEDGVLLGSLVGHTDIVTALAVSPDGGLLASGSRDKTAKLWRLGPPGALAGN